LPFIAFKTGDIMPYGGIVGTIMLIVIGLWLLNTALERKEK
jgi:hypothetical protein